MDKQKIFYVLLTLLLSVISLIIVVKLVLKNDDINQGKFRVTDVILSSSAELTNKAEETDVAHWRLNVSNKNVLAMLLTASSESKISKIYLTDIKVSGKRPITFSMASSEQKLELTNKKQELEIEYVLDENNQIKLEFVALNENILKDWVVPESIKEIICDGRIFTTAGLTLRDISFDLSFKLNILETTGKNNTLNVKLELPSKELLENGADVRRLDASDFKFKVN